jgi:hypothetical protein
VNNGTAQPEPRESAIDRVRRLNREYTTGEPSTADSRSGLTAVERVNRLNAEFTPGSPRQPAAVARTVAANRRSPGRDRQRHPRGNAAGTATTSTESAVIAALKTFRDNGFTVQYISGEYPF